MPRFWLDANVLIEAHNGSYPYDVAVTFWTRLAEQIECGNVVSVRRVYQELAEQEQHQDAIALFVKNRRDKGLCVPPSHDVTEMVGRVEQYIFTQYEYAQAWAFSKGGDPWVIAQAHVDSGIVVTQESALRPQAKKPRVPDVCNHFEVKCVDTLGMFKMLNVRF